MVNDGVLDRLGVSNETISSYINRIKNGDRIITVAGRFSSGKSSFINNFIGKDDFLEVANVECTPVIVELIKNIDSKIIVKYADGHQIQEECSKENIKKYTKTSEEFDRNIVGISIYGEFEGINKNCHLIDTPGTDTPNEIYETIAKLIIQKSDIVIYVFNRTISKSDLDKIEEIKKFTNDIIFVMTHIDEKVDTSYVKMDEEKKTKLFAAASEELKKVVSNPEILVVSSKLSSIDSEIYDEVRELVEFISIKNNEAKVKQRVKLQLTNLFEEKLVNIKKSYDLERKILEKNKKTLEKNYRDTKLKLNNLKLDLEDSNYTFKDLTSTKKRESTKKLEQIYKKAYSKFENNILVRDNFDEDYIAEQMTEVTNGVRNEIKQYLKTLTQSITDDIYESNNKSLNQIFTQLGDEIDISINAPNIEELMIIDNRDIEYLENKLSNIDLERKLVNDEIGFNKVASSDIKERVVNSTEEVKLVKNIINTKGDYIPVYDEILDEGYGNTGRVIGNVLGQVADVAMLFLTPEAGLLKGADMAKDVVMAATMGAQAVDKMTEDNNTRSAQRNSTLNKVAKVIGGIGQKLSVAQYSSILGETVGNLIKSDKIIKKENEDIRIAWEKENNRLKQELNSVIYMKTDLEKDMEESNISLREAMRQEKKLEQEKLRVEQEIRKHQELKQKGAVKKTKEEMKSYYKNEFKNVLDNDFSSSKVLLQDLIDECTRAVTQKNKKEIEASLNSLISTIKVLEDDKVSIDDSLNEKFSFIQEAENYNEWIEEWIK